MVQRIKTTQEEFIQKCKEIHKNKYDYSKVNYINCKTKVKIVCPIHGEFEQTPLNHYYKKHGCLRCAGHNRTNNEFIVEAKKIHGNKYNYSLVDYKKRHDKVKIICPIHGIFEQQPNNHLHGNGCPNCVPNRKLTQKEFIEKANKMHNNKYDYSKADFKNVSSKVVIICPKHGEFKQLVTNHIHNYNGCPKCKMSKGEIKVMNFLEQNKIEYKIEKTFKDCKNKIALPFDFYLPKYNVCIEFQGKQHYEKEEFFGGETALEYTKNNDRIKKEFCKKNKIKLIRIKYNKNINEILTKYLIN
jgi:hypothetical protein